MARHKSYIPHGVIPAVLLPFDADLAIDEPALRQHLRDVAATPGISAITLNAHSTEVGSCTFEEQRRVLAIAQDEIGARLPLISGVWADGSLEAARIARMATEGGASALLVFPPAPFTLGQSAQMVIAHFKRIADTTDLPLIAFQYPLATGQGYPKETLLRLIEEVASIRAIKDWIGNVPHHEWHVRTLQNLARPVNVLTTHSAWLLSSLVLGCNGLLSGSGSVIPDLQSELFHAVQRNDLAAARAVNERIEPLMRIFYADPFVDMHNRMKEALVLLGRLPRACVRPPLVKIGRAEIGRIRQALVEAGLIGGDASRDAA
ncbi:MAG TPA: dihydrodipicolinate synthase family protein [Hyphomicrobiaceae bacterium]|nr:dihydrodipicolinate synthase family protein [Hyphomicrobiaceae bacterium]